MSDNELTSEGLGWSLGAFHAALLLLVLVLATWWSGDVNLLLDEGPATGFIVGAGLLVGSWLGTRHGIMAMKAQRPRDIRYSDTVMVDSLVGGAIAGGAVLAALVIAGAAQDGEDPANAIGLVIALLIFFVPFAAPFAGLAGSLVGLVAGLIDGVLVEVALFGLGLDREGTPLPAVVAEGQDDAWQRPRGY
jgi:hypothetical protein